MRAAAYAVVRRAAPEGLSEVGKRGYCELYESVRTLFPPRAAGEKRTLDKARRSLGCR